MTRWLLPFLLLASAAAQGPTLPFGFVPQTASGPITLEATCTGSGAGTVVACSAWSSTPTVGDVYACGGSGTNNFGDQMALVFTDPYNGVYHVATYQTFTSGIEGYVTAYAYTSSSSAIPQLNNYEGTTQNFKCYAFKGTRSTFTLDPGAVNQTLIATSANPTSCVVSPGCAAAPTNANEVVFGTMVRPATAVVTSGAAPWVPASSTITATGSSYPVYNQYQIQTTATAVNNPMTATSSAFIDNQFALYNAASAAGVDGFTGLYGAPASAQTNNATVTTAILNSVSGSLAGIAPPTGGAWNASGAAAIFDTTVHPLGSLKILVNGVSHTLGDAGTSIKFLAANVTQAIQYTPEAPEFYKTAAWLGSTFRMGSGVTNPQGCDSYNLDSTIVDGSITNQIEYDATNKINFKLELGSGGVPTSPALIPSTPINPLDDVVILTHAAGVNEANHDIYILRENVPGTLPWVVTDHLTTPRVGAIQSTATATAASGGLTSITVAAATAQPFIGQSIRSATASSDTGQISAGTTVTSVSGTCSGTCTIGISLATTASMAATPVFFAGPVATTQSSVVKDSTTLTVTSGTGLVSGNPGTAQIIGMPGVPDGTFLASGSGTTWTMSQPATSTTSGTTLATFWTPQGGNLAFHYGKYSSCNSTADEWFSTAMFDLYGTTLPLIANGTISW